MAKTRATRKREHLNSSKREQGFNRETELSGRRSGGGGDNSYLYTRVVLADELRAAGHYKA